VSELLPTAPGESATQIGEATMKQRSWKDKVAIGQGAYWLATGVWPILHIRSFEAITGPKDDKWLVKTAGLLISCIGGFLLYKGLSQKTDDADVALGVSSAAALTAIDVWYTAEGKISPIYLADAVTEVGLMGAWQFARKADERRREGVARRMDG
jgi:hypothetical protein